MMNKRIKELAEKNVTRFEQDMDGSMEPTKWGDWISYDDLEQFAELIIQECIRLGEESQYKCRTFPVSVAIKDHFGIK